MARQGYSGGVSSGGDGRGEAARPGRLPDAGCVECGYYEHRKRSPSKRSIRHAMLTELINQVHVESRGIYGDRKVHAELTLGHGILVGHTKESCCCAAPDTSVPLCGAVPTQGPRGVAPRPRSRPPSSIEYSSPSRRRAGPARGGGA